MKTLRHILLTAAVALTATSCMQDEVLSESSSGAISFDNTFVDKITRGNDITTDGITEFYVYGYHRSNASLLFNKERVYRADNTSSWTYNNTQFWEKSTDYAFTAIAPSAEAQKYWTYTAATDAANCLKGMGIITFNNELAEGEQDLISSSVTKQTTTELSNTPVSFTFKHRLARIKFRFVNTYEDYTTSFKVNTVQITGSRNTGTFEMNGSESANKWSFTSDDKSDLTLSFKVGIDGVTDVISANHQLNVDANQQNTETASEGTETTTWTTKSQETQHKYIIPDGKTCHVVLNGQTIDGTTTTDFTIDSDVTLDDSGITPGNSYVIVVEFTDGSTPINFKVVKVEPWDSNDKNITESGKTIIDISGGQTDTIPDDVIETIPEESGEAEDEDGTKYIMGNANFALIEFPNYERDYEMTNSDNSTTTTYTEKFTNNAMRRMTYFQYDEELGVFYVKVKSLTSFKIVVPDDDYFHLRFGVTSNEQLKAIWGSPWGKEVTVEVGNAYKLYYSTADMNYLYADGKYNTSTPIEEVTLYFDPATNILEIETNDNNTLMYSFQEYHPSYDSNLSESLKDRLYGITIGDYKITGNVATKIESSSSSSE